MAQLIYNLVNSPIFWICLVVWVLIAVAWASKRELLISRLKGIVSKPIIFENDPNPDSIPFYPRGFLEKVANGFRDTLRRPIKDLVRVFSDFIKKQHYLIYDSEHPLRTFAYLFFLLCFILFAYADSVAITGGLSTLGLISGIIPTFLLNYALAVGVATFLSVIIGFVVLNQTLAQKSELMHFSDERGGAWKGIAQIISFIIVFIGLSNSVLLGISRLIALGFIEATPTTQFIVNLGINVFVLVNGILSASLIFPEAFRGILVTLIAIEWVFIGVFYVIDYVLTAIGSLVPWIVDVLWRLIYIILDILLYIIFNPFIGIVNVFLWPFKKIGPMLNPNSNKPPEEKDDEKK